MCLTHPLGDWWSNIYIFPSIFLLGTAATANRQYHGNQFQPTGKLEGGAHGSTMGGVAQPLPDNKMHATPVFQQHGIPLEAFLPPGKAQAPLPPPPPPKPVGWECPACTYVNKPARPGCEQCGTPRPDDYKVPNDASLDDREKRDAELLKQVMSAICLYSALDL